MLGGAGYDPSVQNRYVPDLGDYSKFGVIRALARDDLAVGLVWYLNPDEEANNDGRHRAYLHRQGAQRDAFRDCLPGVYDALRRIDLAGERHVGAYRRRGVAGVRVWVEEPVPPADARTAWAERGRRRVEGCGLVVIDPDNGLAPEGAGPTPKHATLDECAMWFDRRRRSLVVYQHAHRRGTVEQQIRAAMQRLRDALKADEVLALRFHRGTSRSYLVVPAEPHLGLLRRRAEAMVAGPWGRHGHFSLVGP